MGSNREEKEPSMLCIEGNEEFTLGKLSKIICKKTYGIFHIMLVEFYILISYRQNDRLTLHWYLLSRYRDCKENKKLGLPQIINLSELKIIKLW